MHRRPGVPVVPMGLPTARNRISRHLSRQLETSCVPIWTAGLPSDISLGRRKADEPRSGLEEPDRNEFTLLDAAASDAAGLVRESTAILVPTVFYRDGVRHRTGRPVSVLCAASVAIRGSHLS